MAAVADRTTPGANKNAELMRRFTSFLDADNGRGILADRIREMVQAPDQETIDRNQTPKRLIVSIDDLRDFDPELAADVLTKPVEHLPIFERAMQDLIMGIRQDLSEDRRRLSEFRIGLEGAFGARHVSPRGLNARLVGGIVCVDGIVTRASTIRPRLVLSVHYCPATNKFQEKAYRDNASVSSLAVFTQNAGMPGSSYPTKDEEGNPLETEFGKCWYRDSQRITIQEMPEKSPAGQLPRSVEVLIEGDLCDACKPGDRIRVTGIFRAVGGVGSTGGTGVFTTFVVATHITLLSGVEGRTSVDSSIHEQDIRNFIEYAQKDNVFDRMSKSIAPSICGHDYIKKALLLLLIGGKEQNLENGTHLRGDINIMMVGDPSTAKSQLLRFIMNTAPLAVSTTGRGSSGVGLTAAVTTDQDTGDRHLEAGAMVLADRGVVCIDEFDKMSDEDRVAIHEVMEQQTVTIAKAGIHASLNARCSVVAAANPVYGSYDKMRKPHENIALPDSLLSRFDLLFIVLDSADKERDRQIADHVLRGHRFRKNSHTLDEIDDGSIRGRIAGGGNAESNDGPTPMYETSASVLYKAPEDTTRRRSARHAGRSENKMLSTAFLKLYINYAKHRVSPTLTREAAEHIASSYKELRQDTDSTKTLPITARCLETLIRLATAHAKLRLDKNHVLRDDAVAAVEMLKFALFNQAEPDKSEKVFRRRSRRNKGKGTDDGDDSDDDDTGGSREVNGTGESGTVDDTDGMENGPEPRHGTRRSARNQSMNIGSATSGANESRETEDEITPMAESAEAEGGSQVGRGQSEQTDGGSQVEESRRKKEGSAGGTCSDDCVRRIKRALNKVRGRDGTLQVDDIIGWLAEEEKDEEGSLSEADVRAALERLQEEDVVVVSDDTIFIV